MTIQRQYTLPNCNLILEGLSTEGDMASAPMTVLMNVECHLPGIQEKPLSGGREFLDNLAAAVNRYAQKLLSGVSPPEFEASPAAIELKPGEGAYHHLIVRPSSEPESDDRMEEALPRDIRLTTVQFFDLVDAIDQLVSDRNTLPDLNLPLQPVPRRLIKPAEPAAKRAAPAAIGASALAAAAVALFFVPVPEIEPSRSSESPAEEMTEEAPVEENEAAVPDGEAAETVTPDAAAGAAVVDRLASAPAVDAETEAALIEQTQASLQSTWDPQVLPVEPLRYRLTVSAGGDILGYKYQSDAARDYADSTPLPALTYLPVDPAEPVEEPIAQLQAIFAPDGSVQVLPWQSQEASAESNPGAAPEAAGDIGDAIATDIDDPQQLRQLNQGLRGDIAAAWQTQSLNQPLTYRVRLNADGDIVGYEAVESIEDAEVPLADLLSGEATAGPKADFKVVFTETGVIEVNPWNGWPD